MGSLHFTINAGSFVCEKTLSMNAKFVRSLLVYYDEYTSINPNLDICNFYVMNDP